MDDLICFSKGVNEHIRRLSILLQRMEEYGLKLKAKKCSFLMEKVKYLGHTIDANGIRPDMDRVNDVINKPRPTDQKSLKSFLGFMGFYRIFIKNFSIIAEPLLRLLKKNIEFVWTEEQQEAYNTLKSKLLSEPILIHFDPTNPIELRVDASNTGLGAHLTQIINGKPHLLACASRVLSSNEKNYSTSEKECLAIIWSISKFRQYLYGRKFTIITDHSGLQYLMSTKDLTNRLARWSLKLMDFDFSIKYNKGKNHSDADYLSRNPFLEDQLNETQPNIYEITDNDSVPRTPMRKDKWKPEDTIKSQTNDPFISKLLKFIKNPTNLNKKLKDKLNNNFIIKNNILYKISRKSGTEKHLLVTPINWIREILSQAHDDSTSGHFGVKKTTGRISDHFHWDGMNKDIENYVKSCHDCQLNKSKTTTKLGLQCPSRIAENVMDILSCDLLGPLNVTDNLNKWILTITDQLSKYAWAFPLDNATEVNIISSLEDNIFTKFGPPKIMISDNGKNLTGNLTKNFYKKWGVKHITTTPYHPAGNGQCEKFNHTLATSLSILSDSHNKYWDIYINQVCFAYNTSINHTTGFPPLQLMIGVKPLITIARKLKLNNNNSSDFSTDEIRHKAKENISRTQTYNKNKTNEHRQTPKFGINDLVLLEQKRLKKTYGGKLNARFIGPFKITKPDPIRNLNFIIKRINSSEKPRIAHSTQLKKYYKREDFKLFLETKSNN